MKPESDMDTFSSLGGRKAAIAKLYENSGYSIADTPWFECGPGYCVASDVLLLEGIDFDLTFFPFKHLGYKAVVEATGELFAVMSTPSLLKVTLGISAKLDYEEVSLIWEGVVAAAKAYSYKSVALDLQPSLTGLAINVAATGFDGKNNAAVRPEAKSMDLICVSDNIGAAFLGEQILRKSRDLSENDRNRKLDKYHQLVGAYLKPELSPYILDALKDSGIVPSFGYFCRRSLKDTVLDLCAASGLGAKIYVDKLPLAGGSVDCAAELGTDPLQAALRGGDDNCLLFTIPIGCHERFRHDFQSWDVIGHLARPETGAVLVSPDGLEHDL